MERTKDKLFSFRSTMRDKDSKGRDRLKLYMTSEEAVEFASLVAEFSSNPNGVKLTFHTGKKEAEGTGRTFDSTFGFVAPVQERGSFGAAPAASGGAKKFAPAKKDTATTAAAYQAIKGKQIEG